MYTGTRLTTAIHRRLPSRFFLMEGGRLYTGYHFPPGLILLALLVVFSLLHFAKYFVLALPPFTVINLFLSSWLTLFIALLSAFCAICFSFQFFRHEKFFGLFVCFLMTDVIYCILIAFCLLCFRLEKFYICCYLIADVIHCTLCSGFFAMSISLRLCRYLDYQFVLLLIIGVLSFLFCFSFPGLRSSFIRLFPHG